MLKKNKVYFDTNIFVYLVEGIEIYQSLSRYFLNRNSEIITSELTISECLVKPKMSNNKELEDLYIQIIFYNSLVESIAVSKEILIKSAEVRSKYKIKPFDAIHIATAIQSGCSSIFTNDKQFKVIEGIEVVYLSDFLN